MVPIKTILLLKWYNITTVFYTTQVNPTSLHQNNRQTEIIIHAFSKVESNHGKQKCSVINGSLQIEDFNHNMRADNLQFFAASSLRVTTLFRTSFSSEDSLSTQK